MRLKIQKKTKKKNRAESFFSVVQLTLFPRLFLLLQLVLLFASHTETCLNKCPNQQKQQENKYKSYCPKALLKQQMKKFDQFCVRVPLLVRATTEAPQSQAVSADCLCPDTLF